MGEKSVAEQGVEIKGLIRDLILNKRDDAAEKIGQLNDIQRYLNSCYEVLTKGDE